MITIKIKRQSGVEHTFNVYKVAMTPNNDVIITAHYDNNNSLRFNKWAIGVGDTVYFNDTSFEVNNLTDLLRLQNILVDLKDK